MYYDTIPFGKYQDTLLEDIPTSYLQWVLRKEAGSWCEGLHDDVREELLRRGVTPASSEKKPEPPPRSESPRPPPASPRARGVTRDGVGQVIAAGRRALAAKFHPDVNPDPEALERMQEVNTCADWLEDCKNTLRI